jgi:hypothetical protein
MRLKIDAAAKLKNGTLDPFELQVQGVGRAVGFQPKKSVISSRSKATESDKPAELDPPFDASNQNEDLLTQQGAQATAGSADESVALAAVDPNWYVEPGTTPSVTDAPKPNWFATPAPAEPAAVDPTIGTVIGKTPAPFEPTSVARGPSFSPMGLNALGIGFGGLGLGLAGGSGGSAGGGSTAAKAPTSSIKVVDGPISGAKVYWDMNDNGKYDAGVDKFVGTTDANGRLDIATATMDQHGLLALGGTNDNGMPNMSTLSLAVLADKSASLVVVSPLTSLVSAVYLQALKANPKADPKTSFSDAESAVKSALGLDTGTANLSSIDPTGVGGLQLLKVGVVLASLAAVPESVAASGEYSLASYILRNKPKGGALFDQLVSNDGLQTVFASSLNGLSATDKDAALTTLKNLASLNAQLKAATSATELSSIANLSSNTSAIPRITGLSDDTGANPGDKITTRAQLGVSSLGGVTELSDDQGKTWVAASNFVPKHEGKIEIIARSNYDYVSGNKAVFSGSSDPFEFYFYTELAAPKIALLNDSGFSASDRITNNAGLTTPTPGTRLQYSLDGSAWDESLSAQVMADLKDGLHKVCVRQVVQDGKLYSAEQQLVFILDKTAPSDATAENAPEHAKVKVGQMLSTAPHGIDTDGFLHFSAYDPEAEADSLNATNPLTFSGTADPGAKVELKLNNALVKTTTAKLDDGSWSFDWDGTINGTPAAYGSYEAMLVVTDLAGNHEEFKASVQELFVIEAKLSATFSPEVKIGTDPATEIVYTGQDQVKIIVTAKEGSTFTVSVNDTPYSVVKSGFGEWSLELTNLEEIDYTISIAAKDQAEVETTLDEFSFTVDFTAPDETTVTSNPMESQATGNTDDKGMMHFNAQSLSSKLLTFSGTVDSAATVAVYVLNNGLYTVGHKLHTSDDKLYLYFVDETNQNVVVGKWVATVTATGEDWTYGWNGMVNGRMLADGSYTARVVVTDLAGNVSEPLPGADEDMPFVLDNKAPLLNPYAMSSDATYGEDGNGVMYFNADSLNSSNPLTFSGTVDEGATVKLFIANKLVETIVVSLDDGTWSFDWDGTVDGSMLADGSYTASVVANDLAGNTVSLSASGNVGFVIDNVPEYYSGPADAGYEPVTGTHIAKVKGTAVSVNPLDSLVGHVASSIFVDTVEDYSGNLPEGLTLEDGSITGTPTAAGQTWLAVHSFDFAGNESTTYVQLVVTDSASAAKASDTTIDVNGSSATQYTANAQANTINVTASASVVVFAGLGNDTINIGDGDHDSTQVPFARIDGGGGIDTLSFMSEGESIDLSEFNNPDGSGGVIEHVEKLKFVGSKGNESSVDLRAADVFHLQSDASERGRTLLVLTAASTSNGFVTANLNSEDFAQIGDAYTFTDTGRVVDGINIANYTKFHGSYIDHSGTHDLTVLVQGYYNIHNILG